MDSAPRFSHRAVRTGSNSATVVTQSSQDPRCGLMVDGLGAVGGIGNLPGPQRLDDLQEPVLGYLVVVAVVDLHDRSGVAGAETLHLLQGEQPIGGHLGS